MSDDIAYAKIHPAIGVARVGNSTRDDGWYYGPETPGPDPMPAGSLKDDTGAVKRQAARFRLYGYNSSGKAVRELTATDSGVAIEWGVHVANQKAAWYEFKLALDIPDMKGVGTPRRNKGVERRSLVIDPGRKTLRAGTGQSVEFTGGAFQGIPVPLGRMHTDERGRLVVLGGAGRSGAKNNEELVSFGNNDGWYDDTSDGPVTATLTLDGRPIEVKPAWVVVGPPNYAPDIKTVRTLYDLLLDVFVGQGQLPRPAKVSFRHDIAPLLERFSHLQWVNKGFAAHFGCAGPQDFTAPELQRRLSRPGDTYREVRRQVYTAMRTYERDGLAPMTWPWFYGDGMAGRPRSPRQYMTLSALQMDMLLKWSEGDFVDTPWSGFPHRVEDAPVADQPGLLDRAALDFCLADAFHPGCEVTWPIRHATMFAEPFRILHRAEGAAEPDYGAELTPEKALAADGPLYAQGPGCLTRWMAVPWQTDTASCRSGYESTAGLGPRYDPHLPTFWPARVPNHVLTERDFRIVNKEGGLTPSEDEREAAFANRASWLRGLKGEYKDQLKQAAAEWHHFGVVETRSYTVGDNKYPPRIQVESVPGFALEGVPDDRNLVTLHVPQVAADDIAARGAVLSGLAEDVGLATENITVGYIDKLDPFGEDAAGGTGRPESSS
ncbi:LodA/GoxA family CTQ-dependent oxidase [Streptomyces kunmingensis]|uniref:LodA/GoxA family CTQ-dependent oxidase n=1 Tax=Streptomyces kunmingensis TaxID=68225 RepID=A0ABU6C2K3_9ACTN|nr:LodA/GoxA family CTQ-dependent oxidase [Streptomyces kunmingensis]MEB3958783.1 LodA/GoxA family CTQ-dependent oxidase [Streptomyces kunmingensis]